MWAGNGPRATGMRGAAKNREQEKGGGLDSWWKLGDIAPLRFGEVPSVLSVPFERGRNFLQALCGVGRHALSCLVAVQQGLAPHCACGALPCSTGTGQLCQPSPTRGVSGVLMVLRVHFERGSYFFPLSDGGGLGVSEVSEVLMVHFKRGSVFSRRDSRGGRTQGWAAMSEFMNGMPVDVIACYSLVILMSMDSLCSSG